MPKFLVILLALKLISFKAGAQCSLVVPSTSGYTVTIKVNPVSVIPSSTSCPNGYNYNIVLNYTVTITGTIPGGNLYTLQGNEYCNGGQSLFYSLPLSGGTGSYTTSTNPYISSDGTNVYTTHPSCTAANPTNLGCTSNSVHIQGPGISDRTVNCPTNSTLPVGLIKFIAEKVSEGILLSWETLTETNNSFFEVQRSVDGVEWTTLSRIEGAGTTSKAHSYAYLDDEPEGEVNYYRLKQTDFDGSYSYSAVIYGLNVSKEKLFCGNVWPNPAGDAVHFQLYAVANGSASYRLMNQTGSVVGENELRVYSGTTDVAIPVADLGSGVYLLEITALDGARIYRRIVKL